MDTSAPSPSQLLSLPQEIQDLILEYVLGRKVIHLKRPVLWSRFSTMINTACELSLKYDPINCSESGLTRLPGWCHGRCQRTILRSRQNTLRQDLTVLKTCKHLYVTGTQILYCKNVFSIDFGSHGINGRCMTLLGKFLQTLKPYQLSLLRRLALSMKTYSNAAKPRSIEECGNTKYDAFSIAQDAKKLRRLEGLQELTIEIVSHHHTVGLNDLYMPLADVLVPIKGLSIRTLHVGFREDDEAFDRARRAIRHGRLEKQLRATLIGSEDSALEETKECEYVFAAGLWAKIAELNPDS